MIRRVFAAAAFALAAISAAHAHGGGGVVVVPYSQEMVLPPARVGHYESIHTVAIVSAVGQFLRLEKAALLLPHNKRLDITGWKLDDQVESVVSHYLQSRFAVKSVSADRQAIALMPNGQWDVSTKRLQNYLSSLPHDGIDAFVVVRPDKASETPGDEGLVVENDSDDLFDYPQHCWANYEIDVVDARSLSEIASAYSRIQVRQGTGPGFAGIVCGGALALHNDLALNDKQLAAFHEIFSNLLNVSLLETLRALNIVTLPDVGARSVVDIPANKDPYAGVKTVAVVSAMGDELSFDHLGGTILSQSHETLAVPDWKLDDQVESLARESLGNRFKIVDVPMDRKALLQARLFDSDHKFKPVFPGLQPNWDTDAYVIFIKQPLKRWNTEVGGLGVWNHAPIAAPTENAVFANYAVVVIDAHTLRIIDAYLGTVGPSYSSPEPFREIDPASWPEHVAAATPQQVDIIRSGMVRLLKDSVPETLLHMGLTGKMISTTPGLDAAAGAATGAATSAGGGQADGGQVRFVLP
ncbi:MAG TPA: hypothetical protein VKR31_16610 [Rhizomicrobium sp.]|nr:hypothetical protein [Rhizomicrobium sp.]